MSKTLRIIVFILLSKFSQAQLAIGTNTIDASAKLQVDASNKGFLPPRVTLTGTTDISTISSPATGLLVFNTATTGSGSTAVAPGYYFFEGGKWQRLITQQPDATVEFTSTDNNPNTAGTTFSGTAASKDFIYVSNGNNSQWTYNGTVYVSYTPPNSTPFNLSGSSPATDAGRNKASSIYRSGAVGIGITGTSIATSAQLEVTASNKGFLPPGLRSPELLIFLP